jgi:hypothetical protein
MTKRPRKPKAAGHTSKTAAPKIPTSTIPANIDWQASVLAEKVQRKVMRLEDATRELEDWQDDEAIEADARVASRALIVTHMLNAILKRGY